MTTSEQSRRPLGVFGGPHGCRGGGRVKSLCESTLYRMHLFRQNPQVLEVFSKLAIFPRGFRLVTWEEAR
jgi:hypothetical protein